MSDWWKGAVIYQIYPRSFFDSNNDGIGDLVGISEKLDYIASLNVDAIWISPFFTSPMKDFGYDIADYRAVDPIFGTLQDFIDLLDKAHSLHIKVIIDQVLSHSSDQHSWFIQSRQSRSNPKADWYVWADPQPDGSPPNNWLSFFGGSAWTFDQTRQQYYLHNFLSSQPDLNFHNSEVQAAQLENLKFWLDLGVDGFRLDVANFYFHSQGLENNPVLPEDIRTTVGVTDVNPYSQQQHIFDISQPETLVYLQQMRRLLDSYPDKTTMGEVNGENALGLMTQYTRGDDKLHMAYTFDLLGEDASSQHIRNVVSQFDASRQQGWPCWALGNHDVTRLVTRWGQDRNAHEYTLVAMAMLFSLQGSICIYQGEELGLQEADVAYDDIVDPYGKPFWPEYKGRDGCRTPMPWTQEEHGGFSHSKPWLPVDNRHLLNNVEKQQGTVNSTLNRVRDLLCWRKTVPALLSGNMTTLDMGELLAWTRQSDASNVLCVFNLTDTAHTRKLPFSQIKPLQGHGFDYQLEPDKGDLTLSAYQAFFAEVG